MCIVKLREIAPFVATIKDNKATFAITHSNLLKMKRETTLDLNEMIKLIRRNRSASGYLHLDEEDFPSPLPAQKK